MPKIIAGLEGHLPVLDHSLAAWEVAQDLDSDLPGKVKFTHGVKKGDKARGDKIYSAHHLHCPEKSTMIDLDALRDIQSNEHHCR